MKHIKTFEKFNPLAKMKKLVDKWLTKDEDSLIDAEWYPEEIKKLVNLGFDIKPGKFVDNLACYNSMTIDFEIMVKKYFDEAYPGSASKLYLYEDTYDMYKKFDEFEELLKYIEENIPEEEMAVNKYNL